MERREMLGLLAAGAAGVVALPARESAAQEPAMKLDSIHKECLEACSDCARACDMAFHHCTMQVAEGNREHARPLRFVADCAGFCGLSACNIAKHSPLMAYSCEACSGACKATLAVVSKFDSEEMKAAAKALARCERACVAMVEEMKQHHH